MTRPTRAETRSPGIECGLTRSQSTSPTLKSRWGSFSASSAAKHPDRTALVYYDNRINYRDLDGLANRFARGLAGLGVRKGDRVALYLPNTPQFIIAFYGAIRCGAIVTSLNLLEKGSDIEHQLVDSGAETIVALDLFYPTLSGVIDRTRLRRVIITRLKDFMPSLEIASGNPSGEDPLPADRA